MTAGTQNSQDTEAYNGRHPDRAQSRPQVFSPRADIFEDNESIRILLDMPGVNQGGLEVSLEKDILSVEGHTALKAAVGMRLAHREFGEGDYRRTFTISDAIDRERIAASIKNGVVELVLPKKEEVKPKKIPVRAA